MKDPRLKQLTALSGIEFLPVADLEKYQQQLTRLQPCYAVGVSDLSKISWEHGVKSCPEIKCWRVLPTGWMIESARRSKQPDAIWRPASQAERKAS